MTAQLQSLALESLASFTDLLIQPSYSVLPYEHPGLIVRVLLEGSQIKYEPAFNEFEVRVCLSLCICQSQWRMRTQDGSDSRLALCLLETH